MNTVSEEREARPEINGWEVPARIWLMDLGCGDVTWCDQPDPDGEQIDSVEYVLARTPSTGTGAREAERIYLQFSDDGAHIRKWSREPFEAAEYLAALTPAVEVEGG